MPYLETEGAKVFYELKGDGPPYSSLQACRVIQTAGNMFIKDWLPIISSSCSTTGVAAEPSTMDLFQLADIANDAFSLIEYLGHSKVFLAGHSMGGMIAQEFALQYPERINKLILASTSSKLSDKARAILYDLLEKWENGYDVAEWFRIMYHWLFNPKALSNKKFIDAAIIFALSYPYAQTLEGFRAQVEAITAFDLSDRISEISHETLLISGNDDVLIPTEETAQLLNIGGKAHLKTIEGAAHTLHAEKPEAFIEIIKSFIGEQQIPDKIPQDKPGSQPFVASTLPIIRMPL